MKPILFSTPMVRAILAGRKTQTRQVVKPIFDKERNRYARMNLFHNIKNIGVFWFGVDKSGSPFINDCVQAPRYQPGDILWVRETWANGEFWDTGKYVYKADSENPNATPGLGNWKPSIHMPREAARLFLRVTNVRVERLQEITYEDAHAEGIDVAGASFQTYFKGGQYADLWNALYAKRGYSWDTNPWVWVYEFERQVSENDNRETYF